MRKILFLVLFVNTIGCYGQSQLDDYVGGWSCKLPERSPFLFDVELDIENFRNAKITFTGKNSLTKIDLVQDEDGNLHGGFNNQLKVKIDASTDIPMTFIQIGNHLSYLGLTPTHSNRWAGEWNLLIGENLAPTMYLSFDKFDNGNFGVSTFMKEPTLHYMYCQDFSVDQNTMQFRDIRTNILFKGVLKNGKIMLDLNFLNEKVSTELFRTPYDNWAIGEATASPESNNEKLDSDQLLYKLIKDIASDTLERTHAVVISQSGKITFEHYFDGFTENTPHDTRSLSKSFAAAMIGIAIADEHLEDENTPIKTFFEDRYHEMTWDDDKDMITIDHLLTMTSGMDVIDFGLNRNSYANEGTYRNQPDWTEYILSAPMLSKPGQFANYGSGSPHLLAPIIISQIEGPLEFYIHKKLFQPLGITKYRFQTDNKDQPYFGGGWYFTPRDLLKFGQLHLNKGRWENQQIIPEEWVEKSMKKHTKLENAQKKNEYGFLFWHETYEVGNEKIESIEARGSGGQYLFIIPQYEMVAVITSGNYANNKGFQPEDIMQDYILPELIK